MKINPRDAKGFLEQGFKKFRAVLLCGNNAGLIHERAELLCQNFLVNCGPQAELGRIKLRGADLVGNFGRLTVEIGTLPMFCSKKIIVIDEPTGALTKPLQELCKAPSWSDDVLLVIRGGQLASSDALRKSCEASSHVAVLACYLAEAMDVRAALEAARRQHGLRFQNQAAAEYVIAALSGDSASIASEIDKLVKAFTAKPPSGQAHPLSYDEVAAIIGRGSGEASCDQYIAYLSEQKHCQAEAEFAKLEAGGMKSTHLLRALMRYYMQLYHAQGLAKSGVPAAELSKRLKPPIFFRYVPAFNSALKRLTTDEILETLNNLLALEIRLKDGDGGLGWEILKQAIFD